MTSNVIKNMINNKENKGEGSVKGHLLCSVTVKMGMTHGLEDGCRQLFKF